MNLVMALDNKTADVMVDLAPHKNIFDLNKPRNLTNAARMPKPVASTIASWLHRENDDNSDPKKIAFMQALTV